MLGRAPRKKETLPDFFKIWIPINGTQQYGIGSLEIHKNPRVDGLSIRPLDLGCHSLVSELRLTITYELGWGYPLVFLDIGLL